MHIHQNDCFPVTELTLIIEAPHPFSFSPFRLHLLFSYGVYFLLLIQMVLEHLFYS
eukprot:UN14356